MPLYSFECEKCGEVFDKNVPMVDKGTVKCPDCDYPSRHIPSFDKSNPIFSLKGKWFRDGY